MQGAQMRDSETKSKDKSRVYCVDGFSSRRLVGRVNRNRKQAKQASKNVHEGMQKVITSRSRQEEGGYDC